MVSNKERKRTGRTQARLVKPAKMKYKEAVQEAIEPTKFWDDWKDKKRDGFRNQLPKDQLYHHRLGCLKDQEEVKEHNKRIFKQLIRRKAKLKKSS